MTRSLLSFVLGTGLGLAAGFSAAAAPVQFQNPVLAGDFPDPSVIRVGEDYWATATCAEWAPIFPLLHSKDLVKWELVGHVFDQKPAWSTMNYWAPEICFYKNKYYVFYTARKAEGNTLTVAVASASKPTGPWKDHGPLVSQAPGSIDGMLVEDEKGEPYLVWKEDGNSRNLPTPIWAQKISLKGDIKLVGEPKEILRNDAPWEGQLVEGPFMLHRDGYFYMFYSGKGCCGKGCDYALGVARAKSLLGPYEKNPANPILDSNAEWKCPGHGSIVTTPDGRDYLLYHAYDAQDFTYVGRQGLLDAVTWTNGWPVINGGRGPSKEAVSPYGKANKTDLEIGDDFTDKTLGVDWQWPHSYVPETKMHDGLLELRVPADRAGQKIGSTVARSTVTGDYTATVLLANDLAPGTQAGLWAIGDTANVLGITLADGKVTFQKRRGGKEEVSAPVDAPKLPKVYLRIEVKAGHRFQFAVWDGKDWQPVGKTDVEGDFLPPWDRGVRIGLSASGPAGASVRYEWFRIVPGTLKQTF